MNLPEAHRYVIITDNTVRKLYGEDLLKDLKAQGLQVDLLSIPPGENSKSQSMKSHLDEQLFKLGCKRDAMILALGGGVVGDLAGFVASTYMRGIPVVQIPTTLTAMVDSSIGGKTGINTAYGKNLIGTFWPAEEIILDIKYLETLSKEHIVNGLVEAIKIFITHDAEAFKYVSDNLDAILNKDLKALQKVIQRAADLKKEIVQKDEREKGERMYLNFGHTVGHAIELLSDYSISHGHAVALGILTEAKLAEMDGHLVPQDYTTIEALIHRLGLSLEPLVSYSMDRIWEAVQLDKKGKDSKILYVQLAKIGKVHTMGILKADHFK